MCHNSSSMEVGAKCKVGTVEKVKVERWVLQRDIVEINQIGTSEPTAEHSLKNMNYLKPDRQKVAVEAYKRSKVIVYMEGPYQFS